MIVKSEQKIINLDKGNLMHFIKKNDESYNGFGEIYFSNIIKGTIKGWKKHKKMTMNLCVPRGIVKFVFFTENKKFIEEIIIGESNYIRITVPPGIWFAFQGMSNNISLVCNFSNIIHDPEEVDNLDLNEINYSW